MSETPDSEEESQSSSSSRNISLIEKRLTEEDPDIFDGLKPEKRQQIIREVAYSIQKSHSGPLPDWESLAEYNKIIPNGADRIMKMSEKQSEHRMQLELIVVKGQIK
jgi:hypothetical protein